MKKDVLAKSFLESHAADENLKIPVKAHWAEKSFVWMAGGTRS